MPGTEQLNDLWRDALGCADFPGDAQLASRRWPFEHRATAATIGMQPAANRPEYCASIVQGDAQQRQPHGFVPGRDAMRGGLMQHMALLADIPGNGIGGLIAEQPGTHVVPGGRSLSGGVGCAQCGQRAARLAGAGQPHQRRPAFRGLHQAAAVDARYGVTAQRLGQPGDVQRVPARAASEGGQQQVKGFIGVAVPVREVIHRLLVAACGLARHEKFLFFWMASANLARNRFSGQLLES